ncbi:LD-carboxypeptidase [Photobacterium leiognathi]|uniref:LD-carboxypeptidase n=1 Tax=Photobacterium leiognathi TaxID=553611 RepID=UPI0027398C87|nr:LD-carboxypeptidase [Photobacterium leiognathi]
MSTQYDEQKLDKIKGKLEKAGYKVTEKYLDQVVSDFGYVNNDYSRAKKLINALLDDNIEVIWFVRGGGGGFNLIPYLYEEMERLKSAKPKVLVGFSDVTAIHSFVNEYLKWESLHSVVASYNKDMKDPDDIAISINDLEPLPNIANILKSGISYKNVIPP